MSGRGSEASTAAVGDNTSSSVLNVQRGHMPPRRDQGDGASMPDRQEESSSQGKRQARPFSVLVELDVMQLVLFFMALGTRMWLLDQPRAVVFDELHYGRYASLYMKRTFFFDAHPPLGKMMLALAGHYAGYRGDYNFQRIGAAYSNQVPVWNLRFLPALFGSLLVPLVYQILIELNLAPWTAAIGACLVILDNAMLTQCRFMLMEGPLLFFMALSVLGWLKFRKCKNSPFSVWWWLWLGVISLGFTCAISIKYSALWTILLVMILMYKDFWHLIADHSFTDMQLMKHLFIRMVCLVFIPFAIYLSIFYVHLQILNKAGPHDDVMTSAFQASLEGGLAAITKGQPLHVAYGSQVTLRHTYGQPCWLHSHAHVYPIRYKDRRGSSHQQQVTCYSFKDINNWWLIKDPKKNTLMVDDPVRPVKHGDVIQLVHGLTRRALNSHDVAAPMSPQHQEVTCYIDYNISLPAQNLWKVEIVNREEHGNTWKTIQSYVRLVHVNTTQALKRSGKQLPEWGFYQLEVVTDKLVNQEATVWNVEEHRYTRGQDQEQQAQEMKKAEMIPLQPTHLSFFSKFWELQTKMLMSRHDVQLEHKYSSSPLDWPLTDSNIAYWLSPTSNAQIHLLGNPVIWYSAVVAVIGYSALLVFYLLRRRRQCFDIPNELWQQYRDLGEMLLAGYLAHYIPYFCVDRTLFLHHYIPALLYQILLLSAMVEHIYHLMWNSAVRSVYTMLVAVWLTIVFNVFIVFSVFSYGTKSLTPEQVTKLTWKPTWDFIVHKL